MTSTTIPMSNIDPRGESVPDTARRVGTISGKSVNPTASDAEIMNMIGVDVPMLAITEAATANLLTAVSPSNDFAVPEPGRRVMLRIPFGGSFVAGPTIATPLLKIDGGVSKSILASDMTKIDLSQVREGTFVELQYAAADGGHWAIVTPAKPSMDLTLIPTVRLTATPSSTIDALKVTTPTGKFALPPVGTRFLLSIPATHDRQPTIDVPTISIDGGAALRIYASDNGFIDPFQLTRQTEVTMTYSPSFGGLMQVTSPARPKRSPGVEQMFTTSSTGEGAVVTTGSQLPWSMDRVYLWQPQIDASVVTPTIARDGLPALKVYASDGNLLPLGYIRAYRRYLLGYSPAFGGHLYVVNARESFARNDTYRAIQIGEEAKAGTRSLYREAHPIPADWQTIYENGFDSQADCDAFECANGSLSSATMPSYQKLTFVDTNGGYAKIDCTADPKWSDHNHIWPGPGMLNLLAAGYSTAAAMGSGGPGVLPAVGDMTNMRVEIELRAASLVLPPETRLALHVQMRDDQPGGTNKPVNYIYAEKLIDDALGFGGEGLGWPHLNGSAQTTDWVTFTADFAPNDAFFQCIGYSAGRRDTYVAAPIKRALLGTLYDIIIVALHPQQDGHLSMPVQRLAGQLHIRRVTLKTPN